MYQELHWVRVTQARIDCEGSIAIDSVLMEVANILPVQLLHINSMLKAADW